MFFFLLLPLQMLNGNTNIHITLLNITLQSESGEFRNSLPLSKGKGKKIHFSVSLNLFE